MLLSDIILLEMAQKFEPKETGLTIPCWISGKTASAGGVQIMNFENI